MSSAPIRRVLTPALNRLAGYNATSRDLLQAADAGNLTPEQTNTLRQQNTLLERSVTLVDRQNDMWLNLMRNFQAQELADEEARYNAQVVDGVHFTEFLDRARETLDLVEIVIQRIDDDDNDAASVSSRGSRRGAAPPRIRAKLPKLELPTFSGDPLEWPTFWQQFTASVGNQPIATVDKFGYLKSKLTGRAEDAIRGYDPSDANYNIVINILQRRFGDPAVIQESLQAELINLRPAANESTSELRRVSETIERVCRQLHAQGFPEDNPFILSSIKSKLPWNALTELVKTEKASGARWTTSQYRTKLVYLIEVKEEVSRCTSNKRSNGNIVSGDASKEGNRQNNFRRDRRDRRQNNKPAGNEDAERSYKTTKGA